MTRHVLSIDVGVRNYAVCAVNIDETTFEVLRLQTWDLGDAKAVPASQLIDRLLQRFEQWEFLRSWAPEMVVVEQQLRGAHLNMALGFATYTWARTRGYTTRFVRPLTKFRAWKRFPIDNDTRSLGTRISTPPKAYRERKRLSIDLCQALLEHTGQPLLSVWCSASTKQDDLADALLQALAC